MKIYLDDFRDAPSDDWIVFRSVPPLIAALKKRNVDVVSLDHDLGNYNGTGYDVLVWIENETATNPEYNPPEIRIHTSNPAARGRMESAVESIRKIERSR